MCAYPAGTQSHSSAPIPSAFLPDIAINVYEAGDALLRPRASKAAGRAAQWRCQRQGALKDKKQWQEAGLPLAAHPSACPWASVRSPGQNLSPFILFLIHSPSSSRQSTHATSVMSSHPGCVALTDPCI